MRVFVVLGLAAFVAFAALGAGVAFRAPGPIDLAMLGTYGAAEPLARFLTAAGRFPAYAALCVAALAFAAVRRSWLARAALAVAGIVVVWQTSDLAKLAFHRPRPAHPILAESSFGYPSGHADLALFFYGFWAYLIWRSNAPVALRRAAVAFAAIWIVAIGWSRIALGAHYPSDVAGGYLFGAGWLGVAIALARRIGTDGRARPRRANALD